MQTRDCRVLLIRVPRDSAGKVVSSGAVKAMIATKEQVLIDKNGDVFYREWIAEGLKPLPFYNRHSPDGFNIGYGGSGCAELAYSVCKLLNAEGMYQQFKWSVIAHLDRDKDYDIPLRDLERIIERLKSGNPIQKIWNHFHK